MGNGITATVSAASEALGGKALEVALPKEAIHPSLLNDPVFGLLTWVVALVALIISLGKPIKDYLRGEHREDKKDKVNDSKANAESSMYDQLSSQVAQYRELANTAYRERNDLIQRVGALEAKAEDLVEQKQLVEKLKDRLDKKDEEIRDLLAQATDERKQFLAILNAKDAEIAKRDDRILLLERGLRELEMRLADEERITQTFICPIDERRRRGRKKATDGDVVEDGVT